MNTVNTDINTELTTNVNTKIMNIPKSRNTVVNRVVVANAPVRIDLAGGWSDTPPICYETEGAVRLKIIILFHFVLSFNFFLLFISITIIIHPLTNVIFMLVFVFLFVFEFVFTRFFLCK